MLRSENKYDRQVLQAIASGGRVTQRSISSHLGVALGLTNLVIRRLVSKGYVRIGPRHVRYQVTPAGWKAVERARRLSFENTVHLYTKTREQICATLASVSGCCEITDGRKRVVFYGAGDVAEIAYVSVQRTDLTLVGIVDDDRRGRFFDLVIVDSEHLTAHALGGTAYSRVIVTSVRDAEAIRARLRERGVPADRVCCL